MYLRFMVCLHLSQQIPHSFKFLHHLLMMTVALHRCSGHYLVAHQYIDLQILPLMVSQFQPLNIIPHEVVIFLVLFRWPVVVRIFLLLCIVMIIRIWKRTLLEPMTLILMFLNMFLFHLVLWAIRTAVAASISSGFISGSLGNYLLVLRPIAHKQLLTGVELRERTVVGLNKIYILWELWVWCQGIISVVLTQLMA